MAGLSACHRMIGTRLRWGCNQGFPVGGVEYTRGEACCRFCAGDYRVLPSCIEDLAGSPDPPPPAQQAATMRLMDHILRVTLLQVGLLFRARAAQLAAHGVAAYLGFYPLFM